tara:strand:+ start:1361 stop:1510 length:150 start_codon:yes stop_codon:yes gene_type:complete
LAATGEIPGVRTVPARRTVVHPTLAQWPIANVLATINNRSAKGVERAVQ